MDRAALLPSPEPARLVRVFGLFRAAAGVGMLLAPTALPRLLLGADRASARRMGWLARMVGGRELAIGVQALNGPAEADAVRAALRAQLVADAADGSALALAVSTGRVKRLPAAAVVAFAAFGVAAEVRALRRLR